MFNLSETLEGGKVDFWLLTDACLPALWGAAARARHGRKPSWGCARPCLYRASAPPARLIRTDLPPRADLPSPLGSIHAYPIPGARPSAPAFQGRASQHRIREEVTPGHLNFERRRRPCRSTER